MNYALANEIANLLLEAYVIKDEQTKNTIIDLLMENVFENYKED